MKGSFSEHETSISQSTTCQEGILAKNKVIHTGIEDLHKIFWTEELVHYFFDPMFSKVEIKSTWKHREDELQLLKCPGIIIKSFK